MKSFIGISKNGKGYDLHKLTYAGDAGNMKRIGFDFVAHYLIEKTALAEMKRMNGVNP